jgi:glutamate-1-semialdehyde aminotransferase
MVKWSAQMTPPAEPSPTSLVREVLNSKADQALAAMEARAFHSWRMALDRSKVLPSTTDVTGAPSLNLFVQSSSGAHVTDIDGTRLLDLCMGFGAQMLGHAHPTVRNAIVERASRGWQRGLPSMDQTELAMLIQSAGPANDRVALCDSSNSAASLAMRVARAATGKTLVGLLSGSVHNAQTSSPANTQIGGGLSQADDRGTTILPYGHTAIFDLIRRRRNDLAAIIVEPARGCEAGAAHTEWLHQLSATCRDSGVILILDEVLTGFRVAYGGTQEMFGLVPDLVIYGNVIGGGLSLGAIAGRTDILEILSQSTTNKSTHPGDASASNPLSVSAGTATLRHLWENRATVYPALNKTSDKWAKDFNALTAAERLPVEIKNIGSMYRFVFHKNQISGRKENTNTQLTPGAAFNVLMLSRGVLTHASHRGFISLAHTKQDLDDALVAAIDSVRDLRDDGYFSQHRH